MHDFMQEISNIHCFKYENIWIVFDSVTLSIFKCKEEVYEYLNNILSDCKIVGEIQDELNEYIKRGYFSDTKVPSTMEHFSSTYVISVQNTLECPLNCNYCFAKKIKSNERVMTKQTATKLLDFVFEEFDDKADSYEFYFTSGGEPLTNFSIIKQIYNESKVSAFNKDKNVMVGITTNSVLLDNENLDYLQNEEIALALSIDGEKNIHDKNRIYKNGKGTYDCVIAALNKLKNSDNPYINSPLGLTVLTDETANYIRTLKHLVDIGFKKVVLKPVKNITNEKVNQEYVSSVKVRYKELVDFIKDELINNRWKYILPIINSADFLGSLLIRLLLKQKTIYRCDAGKSRYSILPNGEIYPCDYFSMLPEFKMGTLELGLDDSKNKYWREISCLNVKKCSDCWARFICSGTCYYTMILNNGEPDEFECEIKKYLIEQLVGLIYSIREENQLIFKHLIEKAKKAEERQHDVLKQI